MYEIRIKKTSRPAGRGFDWQVFDVEYKQVDTIEDVQDFLFGNSYPSMAYNKKTRMKMYVDDKNGDAKHIGYIYRFKASWGGDNWYEQHWTEVNEISKANVVKY